MGPLDLFLMKTINERPTQSAPHIVVY